MHYPYYIIIAYHYFKSKYYYGLFTETIVGLSMMHYPFTVIIKKRIEKRKMLWTGKIDLPDNCIFSLK